MCVCIMCVCVCVCVCVVVVGGCTVFMCDVCFVRHMDAVVMYAG